MKKFLVIITLFICNAIHAQDKMFDVLPLQDGKVVYTGVVEVDSANKDVLYSRAKKWFAEEYKSAQNVIQLDDKDAGEVLGKGLFKSYFTVFMEAQDVSVYHTVKIYVKDNKYKYEITDFNVKFYVAPSKYNSAANYDDQLENFVKGRNKNNMHKMSMNIDSQVQDMIASLEKDMKSKSSDNW